MASVTDVWELFILSADLFFKVFAKAGAVTAARFAGLVKGILACRPTNHGLVAGEPVDVAVSFVGKDRLSVGQNLAANRRSALANTLPNFGEAQVYFQAGLDLQSVIECQMFAHKNLHER